MKTGPKYKIARRLGESSIFSKTQGPKFALSSERKGGKKRGGRPRSRTEYGIQLIEKQKVRYSYGVSEKQLSNYVKAANKGVGAPHDLLFQELERRLDNVVYRSGFVHSRAFARQVVSHGHIYVNGRRMNIPSYQVRKGDKITIRPESMTNSIFANVNENTKDYNPPAWIKFNEKKLEAEVGELPEKIEDASVLNFGAIIQFYSRV